MKEAHGVWGIVLELPRACQAGWHEGGMNRDFHREALNPYEIILHPGESLRWPAAEKPLTTDIRRPVQTSNNVMMLIIKILCLFLSRDKTF